MTAKELTVTTTSRDPNTGSGRHATWAPGGPPPPARPAPRPRRRFADLFLALAGAGLGATIAITLQAESASSLSAPGGVMTAIGRMTGMVGTFLMLVTILIIGRLPALERAIGQDRLVTWHRWLGPWILILIGAHGLFTTVGYAQGLKTGLLHEFVNLMTTYPGMLAAAVGLGLLLLAGVTSYRNVRRRMRYETWWSVHLYTYLAAALSFTHQLATGSAFLNHPVARAYWIALWALTAGVVIVYRFGLPIVRSLRHRLRVESVREEAPGVFSIVLRGHRLDRLPVAGGQFMQWRFLRRHLWWQAHPYSLSAMPTATHLRLTVKDLGDHSGSLAALRPGTLVAIEGPYGAFTKHARMGDRVVLVGAGVGATPIRALLDDLPASVDVDVVLRASTHAELILRDEIAQRVAERGGRLHELVGPRSRVPVDAATLRRLVPDVAACDLYVCGPTAFTAGVIDAAAALDVPKQRIHYEEFAF
jgi:predicted ferric reductase